MRTSCGISNFSRIAPGLAHDRQLGRRGGQHADERRRVAHVARSFHRAPRRDVGADTACRRTGSGRRPRRRGRGPRRGRRRAPVTAQDAAAGGDELYRRRSAVPAWNTIAPFDRARRPRRPSIGDPGRYGPGYPPLASTTVTPRRRRTPRGRLVGARLPVAHACSSVPRSVRHPREQDLRLGVAEPAVELEHLRPVGGEHQPGVQHAAVRHALGLHRRTVRR